MIETSNPVVKKKVVLARADAIARMTINGTIIKTVVLVGLLSCSSLFVWSKLITNKVGEIQTILQFSLPLTLILGWVTYFKPKWSPFTTPVYALSQGVLIGFFSSIAEQIVPGIISQAVPLTISVLLGMLLLYLTKLVRVTHKLQTIVIGAITALMLTYFFEWILSFFSIRVPFIHETGPVGIIFSLAMVFLASFTLLLDFEAIYQNEKIGAPKYMEWYYAYGLLISIVWLYSEVMKLLLKSKVSKQRR